MITFPVKFGGYKTVYASDMPSFQRDFAGEKTLNHGTGPDITFTRSSGGTYFDAAGVLQTAANNVPRFDHDPTRVNLLLHSEAFDNAAWTKTRSSISANIEVAPDGTSTADKLVENTDNNTHFINAVRTASNETVTFSVYAKAAERSSILLELSNFLNSVTNARFDLSSGTANTPATSGADYSNVSSSISSVGGGWYRCVLTATKAAVNTNNNPTLILHNGTSSSYTGNGTSGLYIWGAQLQIGSTATTYLPTTTTVAAESRGLLIEEARTNSIRNSTMQGAVAGTPGTLPTYWIANVGGITPQVVAVGTEDGLAYVDLKFSATNTTGSDWYTDLNFDQAVITATLGQTWTASLYAKLISGGITSGFTSTPRLTLYGCTPCSDNATALFTGINNSSLRSQRFVATRTLSLATTTAVSPRLTMIVATGATVDFTIRIAAPQLVQGAFATSYIPTTNATATRAADSAVVTPISSFYNQIEGTLIAQSSNFSKDTFPTVIAINDGTTSHRINIVSSTSTTNRLSVAASSTLQANFAFSNYSSDSVVSQIISAKANDFAASVDGATVQTDTSGSMPTVTQMEIGLQTGGLNALNGHIRKIAYWPKRLSNAVLQALTT